MAIRKALAYSKKRLTAYTRKSKKVKHLNYIKAVPQQKIVKFNMGDINSFNQGKFSNIIRINSEINAQIRDLALEACRQMIHNRLTKKFVNNYYFACKVFPHQVVRDNKTFSGGTKGERVQSGMKHSFGSTIGRSAPIKAGQTIYEIAFPNKKDALFIRKLCKSAVPKLPCKTKIIYEEIK